jgi:uncharacterized membrane protein
MPTSAGYLGVSLIEETDVASAAHLRLSHDGIVLAGTLAAMAIVGVAFAVGPAISAVRGHGTSGWFTNAEQECLGRVGCSWVGTFVSESGHQVVPGVTYDGSLPAGALASQRIPAVYTGLHAVFPPHGSHYWIPAILLMVLVGGAVALFLWISPLGSGSARAGQQAGGSGLA